MGTYLNPGKQGFEEIVNGEYIDKTGLIELINERIGTTAKLVCVSRPRRFGKSYAAKMLCAYYDHSCDSTELFRGLAVSDTEGFKKHLNQYHVVSLDISGFISGLRKAGQSLAELPEKIVSSLERELKEVYPELQACESLSECFIKCVEITGRKFIFIIDEWDGVIREAKDSPEIQKQYLDLLREWFKNNNFTPQVVAAAYMTGILPIKKDGSQSAISDFREYTVLKPRRFAEYVGFTEREVMKLCEKHDISFPDMKKWYDGYEYKGIDPVYNPNSVMQAVDNAEFDSYWVETSASESLMEYISQDYNGMTRTVAELIGGMEVPVSISGFANDLTTFRGKDDVLTLLAHLGYLAYHAEDGTVRIPNEEIRMEFSSAVREVKHSATLERLKESDRLFYDTIHGNEEAVAAQIEKIHAEETVPLHYNREDSLRSVIKLAYFTYRDNYLMWEELPSGDGYADIVYLPKRASDYPALVIELKWNHTAEGAIRQILDRRYPEALKGFGGEILLVGISYNRDEKGTDRHHTCKIQRL